MDARARDGANEGSPASRRESDAPDSVRVRKPRRAAPADAVRPTRAEVNLAALRHNLRVVAKHAGAANANAKVWPVLKADGYGHGAPAVARTLERAGAQGFCVALLEEAVELRDAGIRAPILVMGGYQGAYEEVAHRRVIPVVYDAGQLESLARAARAAGETLDVHLKIDTGMGRLGVRMEDLENFAARLAAAPEARVVGLMTHLACADSPDPSYTNDQVARFEKATARLARAGVSPMIRHAANSAALLRGKAIYDLVRPGIAIFGVSPMPAHASPASPELWPVMRVRSEIVDLRTVQPGESVGYGALFRATRPSRIATIPMGYADGLSRQLSNKGHVLVDGRRAPIVGAISMDMAMIDVTDLPRVELRDEVVVLGGEIGADEVARHAGTIAWEVLTSISRRVPRFYREP